MKALWEREVALYCGCLCMKDKIMKKWITPVVEELDINATAHRHHGGNNGGNNGGNKGGNNGNGANIPCVPPTMDDVVGGDNNTDGMS